MKDIAIYGAGGFGREILSMIDRINSKNTTWNFIGYIDDGLLPGTNIGNYKVLGGIDFLNEYQKELAISIAIGNVKCLKSVVISINNKNIWFPNMIDISATVDPTVIMGKGNIITFSGFISCNVLMGDFNLLNIRCCIGHDSFIGSYNIFNPGIQISGGVRIENENFWGLNSSIVQYKKVGSRNTIGACSLLLNNIKDDSIFFGIPAIKR